MSRRTPGLALIRKLAIILPLCILGLARPAQGQG